MHEPGQVRIIYEEGNEDYVAESQAKKVKEAYEKNTPLTAFFELMSDLPKEEREKYRFDTVGKDFFYDKEAKKWKRRSLKLKRLVRIGSAAAGNRESQVRFYFIYCNIYIFI